MCINQSILHSSGSPANISPVISHLSRRVSGRGLTCTSSQVALQSAPTARRRLGPAAPTHRRDGGGGGVEAAQGLRGDPVLRQHGRCPGAEGERQGDGRGGDRAVGRPRPHPGAAPHRPSHRHGHPQTLHVR